MRLPATHPSTTTDPARLRDFDAFLDGHLRQVRRRLAILSAKAEAKQAANRQARHQITVDYDLEQQPFRFTSAMGPRARTLSELEGDE